MSRNFTVKKIVGFAFVLGLSVSVQAQQLVYITGTNKIGEISDASNPSIVTGPFNITGLPAGQVIEAIDYRPLTGELYALGYNPSTQEAQLFVINQATAFATAIGSANVLDLVPGKIGFDFNPTVDRIRVTSSNGSNYRLHPATGAVAATDGSLAFAGADVNAGATPSTVASAYTRSYIGSETTTLYNVDFSLNILTTQNPPNNGTLNTVGNLTLTFNLPTATVGLDFFYDGNQGEEKGFLSANTNNAFDSLYTVDVTTGNLTNAGQIGNGIGVRDIAAVIKRVVPALSGEEAYALTGLDNLISFDTDRPELVRSLVKVTGITAGQTILGMDFRPATNGLYALGYDRPFSQYQLYTIDVNTGVATAVNTSPIGIELDTAVTGFDFNPMVDKIRVVGAGGENYRINPDNGSLVGVDTDVAFAAGDANFGQAPFISTVAYTNSYPGALSTTLYAFDTNLDIFASIDPPNGGKLNTLGLATITVADGALDVYFNLMDDKNDIYLASNGTSSTFDNLYILENNIFQVKGAIGFGIPVKDLAIVVGDAPANLAVTEFGENVATLSVYPNPADDMIQIKSSNMVGKTFKLNDMTGRTLFSGNITTQNVEAIDVTSYEAGIYFVVLEDGTTVKWIKK